MPACDLHDHCPGTHHLSKCGQASYRISNDALPLRCVEEPETSKGEAMHLAEVAPEAVRVEVAKANPVSLAKSGSVRSQCSSY